MQTPTPIGFAPFQATKDQILVGASVNGHPGTFIFDTGFGGDLVVDGSMDLGKSTGTTQLQDFVGAFSADTYAIKELKLGTVPMKVKGKTAIAQPSVGSMGGDHHVDGLMGFSLIKDYVTTISFQKDEFIFYPSSLDISTWKPNNKTTFLLHMLPLGPNAIVLPVKTADGKEMVMSLDTGNSFYATTHKDVLQRVGLWPQDQDAKFMNSSFVASGEVDSWDKYMKDMTIFGVPVQNSIWDIIDLPASDASSDGTVGYQFLKNFNITFDFQRRLVWLENITGKVENEATGRMGISFAYDQNQKVLVVQKVAEGGPADGLGLAKGDKVISINNRDLATIPSITLEKFLSGPVGTKVTLAISHQGFVKRYTITLAALVNP